VADLVPSRSQRPFVAVARVVCPPVREAAQQPVGEVLVRDGEREGEHLRAAPGLR